MDGQTQDGDVTKVTTDTDGKQDEVLAVLNATLKRDFKTRDEALKSVDNLHRMVGDNAIAELREKAKEAENFSKVIDAVAKAEGLDVNEARKQVLDELMNNSPAEVQKTEAKAQQQTTTATDSRYDKLAAKLDRLEERDLLETYPEAKNVIKELKDLKQVYSDKELKEIYEASSLKEVASKAANFEKAETEKAGAGVESKSRQADLAGSAMKDLVHAAQNSGLQSDRQKLVEAYFGDLK
jgi:hypothetical protein